MPLNWGMTACFLSLLEEAVCRDILFWAEQPFQGSREMSRVLYALASRQDRVRGNAFLQQRQNAGGCPNFRAFDTAHVDRHQQMQSRYFR